MDLKAIATELPVYLEIKGDGLTGPLSVIWDTMRTKLNFSLQLTLGHMEYGELFSDKNGSGVFGSLIRNETHFSVVPLYATENGVKWLDYTTFLLTDEWALISGPPQIFFADNYSFLKSFDKSLWKMLVSVLFSYALCRTSIAFIVKSKREGWDLIKSFGSYLFSSMRALVNQHHDVNGNRTYERLSWISWTIPSMLLTLSFTGLLLAKLTKKDDPFHYETLEDILQHPNIKLLLEKNSWPCNEIKASKDPIKIKIWNKVNVENTVKSLNDMNHEEIMNEMRRGKLIWMVMRRGFLIGSSKMCGKFSDFYIAKKTNSVSSYTLYMRKEINVKIRNTIKYVSQKIVENHLLNAKFEFLESMGRLCTMPKTPETLPLDFKTYSFLLILWICPMICGLTSLVIELLVSPSPSKYRKRLRKLIYY